MDYPVKPDNDRERRASGNDINSVMTERPLPSIASPARCGLTGVSGGMEAEQPLIFTDLNISVNMHRQNNAERCHNRQHNRSAVRNQRQRNADHRNKPENH